jgi:hypothetical protein
MFVLHPIAISLNFINFTLTRRHVVVSVDAIIVNVTAVHPTTALVPRSRTGCHFQPPFRIPRGGGGCCKSKSPFKWKKAGSTRRKSGRHHHHDKPLTEFGTRAFTSSNPSNIESALFRQACFKPKEFYFFDALDNMDDILFHDAFTSISDDLFHPCFDYCIDEYYFNRYKETCIEQFFDTIPYKLPTTLLNAIIIDSLLGNNDWRNAYNVEVYSNLSSGNNIPLNSKPLFRIQLNGTHKVQLGPVVPFNTTFDDQVKPNSAFVDCPASFDAYLLNDRSSLTSPSDSAYCLPCIDSFPSSSSVNCFLQSFDVLAHFLECYQHSYHL